MVVIIVHIHGVEIVKEIWWESGFLRGLYGTPLGTNGSECTLVTEVLMIAITVKSYYLFKHLWRTMIVTRLRMMYVVIIDLEVLM